MGKQKIDRTGEQKLNKGGSLMTILEYNNTKDITVDGGIKFMHNIIISWKEI